MRNYQLRNISFLFFLSVFPFIFSGCASNNGSMPDNSINTTGLPSYHGQAPYSASYNEAKYASLLPQQTDLGGGKERVIVVDPSVHAWGAYDTNGQLVRAGIATAGADFCKDEGKPCRTDAGTFRVFSMGSADCKSRTYPLPKGGSLMPYCMFFNRGQSLHGSPDQMMVEQNISHGCVHMRIPDAEWLRYNFARVGTKVVIMPY